MDLVDQARSTLLYGEAKEAAASATHPPPALRRAALQQQLEELIDQKQAESARSLASVSAELMTAMWEQIESDFRSRHAAGVRPAPSWGV